VDIVERIVCEILSEENRFLDLQRRFMQYSIEDKAYLWDIVDACEDILQFTKCISFEQFESDKIRRFAVERQLLVIGEASKGYLHRPRIIFQQSRGRRSRG